MLPVSEGLLLPTTSEWPKCTMSCPRRASKSWLSLATNFSNRKTEVTKKYWTLYDLDTTQSSLFSKRWKSMGQRLTRSIAIWGRTVRCLTKSSTIQRWFLGTSLSFCWTGREKWWSFSSLEILWMLWGKKWKCCCDEKGEWCWMKSGFKSSESSWMIVSLFIFFPIQKKILINRSS